MSAESYKTLIIDDEHLARKLLSEYVQKIPALSLIGTCSNAFEALQVMQTQKVDIIFSDIQMPDLTGLELMRMLKEKPSVIFTTAYSEHALESYELEAVDYLLKPIAFPRFYQAANKAIERIRLGRMAEQPPIAIGKEANIESQATKGYLMVKADHKVYRINLLELLFVEGQGEYVTFHLQSRRITAYYSLKKLEEELPETQFVRIHKSFIVALNAIESLEGNMVIIANQKIGIGKMYKETLMKLLNN
ncbi:MAG: LytTR family DNA-binding domain-containing protein [Bacteroidales bacterium]|nr:LytTR family DNA-binding domain-containing protein [Bacteroidales bacterium]